MKQGYSSQISKEEIAMNTLKDFIEKYYTGEPYEVALGHLADFLRDLDMINAFEGGVWGPDDIMDNIEIEK